MPPPDPAPLAALADRGPDAVLLDFNGTLSDDEPLLARIFTALFAEHLGWRMTTEEYYAELAGHSDREIVETAVRRRTGGVDAALVGALLAERRRRYRDLAADEPTVRDGTRALVDAVADAGLPLAVVTGAQRADVDVVLDAAGLAASFAFVVAEEDVARGKPDPEGFLLAAGLLGLGPDTGRDRSAIVVVEDSVAGVRAAKAAGMTCIAVTGTTARTTLAREADAVVDAQDTRVLPLLGLDRPVVTTSSHAAARPPHTPVPPHSGT